MAGKGHAEKQTTKTLTFACTVLMMVCISMKITLKFHTLSLLQIINAIENGQTRLTHQIGKRSLSWEVGSDHSPIAHMRPGKQIWTPSSGPKYYRSRQTFQSRFPVQNRLSSQRFLGLGVSICTPLYSIISLVCTVKNNVHDKVLQKQVLQRLLQKKSWWAWKLGIFSKHRSKAAPQPFQANSV